MNLILRLFFLLLIASCNSSDKSEQCNSDEYINALILSEKQYTSNNFKEKSFELNKTHVIRLIESKVLKNSNDKLFCFFEKHGVSDKKTISKILFNCVFQLKKYNSVSFDKLRKDKLLGVLEIETKLVLCSEKAKKMTKKNFQFLDIGNQILITLPAEKRNNKINTITPSCNDFLSGKSNQTEISFTAIVITRSLIEDSSDVFLNLHVIDLKNSNVYIRNKKISEGDSISFSPGKGCKVISTMDR